MKLTWKNFSATALAAVMALSLAGCGGSKSDDAKASGNKVLKFGVVNFADNLEPTTMLLAGALTQLWLRRDVD